MTTIAFDGRYLAADGHMVAQGTTVSLDVTKIKLGAGTHAYALAGTSNLFEAWVDWAEHGADYPRCHDIAANDGSLLRLDLVTRQLSVCSLSVPHFQDVPAPHVRGSGRDHAITAMDCGLNAMEAVCMAARRDPNTKGVVRYIDLDALDKGVQVWPQLAEASPPHFLERWHSLSSDMRATVSRWFKEPMTNRMKEPPKMLTIIKPTKSGVPSPAAWGGDCTGRLIDETGCGHCLRCNREWYALVKQWASATGASSGQLILSDADIEMTRREWQTSPTVLPPAPDEPVAKDGGAADMFNKMLAHMQIEQIDRGPNDALAGSFRLADGAIHEYVEFRTKELDNMISARFALADMLKAYLKSVPTADRLVWRNRPSVEKFARPNERDVVWVGYMRLVALPATVAAGVEVPAEDAYRQALRLWVEEWNACSKDRNLSRIRALDIELRSMTFPEGCHLIHGANTLLVPGAPERTYATKQIVWADGTKTPEA